MLYHYPKGTFARLAGEHRPAPAAPLAAAAGATLSPDLSRYDTTFGWCWCGDSNGGEGYVPLAWIAREAPPWRLMRDYSALELAVSAGDRVELRYCESGWAWVRAADRREGWLPDWLLILE